MIILAAAKMEVDQRFIEHTTIYSGIGAIHAAMNFDKLKSQIMGQDVLYIGSCGAFSPYELSSLVTFKHTFWVPQSLRLGISYLNPDWHQPIEIKNSLLLDLPQVSMLTSEGISYSSVLNFSYPFPPMENMEAYVLAQLAPYASTFTPILGVTNLVGIHGHDQWLKNHKHVASKTFEYIFELIKNRLKNKNAK